MDLLALPRVFLPLPTCGHIDRHLTERNDHCWESSYNHRHLLPQGRACNVWGRVCTARDRSQSTSLRRCFRCAYTIYKQLILRIRHLVSNKSVVVFSQCVLLLLTRRTWITGQPSQQSAVSGCFGRSTRSQLNFTTGHLETGNIAMTRSVIERNAPQLLQLLQSVCLQHVCLSLHDAASFYLNWSTTLNRLDWR